MEYKIYDNINEISVHEGELFQAKEDIYDLWRECFGDTKAYTDFYFHWKVRDNQILTAYKEDKISAMLHLNPYTLRVKEKTIQANYIVGVATRQQDRRQGLMKLLLERALQQMYQQQMPFTYLMPAAEAIYYPFGFRIVYEQEPWRETIIQAIKSLDINSQLTSNGSCSVSLVALELENAQKLEELVCFSNLELAKHYDIFVLRSAYYFKRLIHEMKSSKGEVLLIVKNNQLIGYVAYMAEETVQIAECYYMPEEKEAVINALAIRFATTILSDKAEEKSHAIPTIMIRIVHWKSFIKTITAREGVTLTIEVQDPILTKNNGIYELQFSGEGCNMILTDKEPELLADISDLTMLFFGKLSKKQLEGLICNKEKDIIITKLNKLNYYNPIFINDVV